MDTPEPRREGRAAGAGDGAAGAGSAAGRVRPLRRGTAERRPGRPPARGRRSCAASPLDGAGCASRRTRAAPRPRRQPAAAVGAAAPGGAGKRRRRRRRRGRGPGARLVRRRAARRPRPGAELMNFELTEDQKRIRDAVRDFAAAEIAPRVAEREKEERFPREIIGRLGELGVLGMMVPEDLRRRGRGRPVLRPRHRGARARERVDGGHRLGQQLRRLLSDLEVRHRGAEDDDPERARLRQGPRRLRSDRASVRLGRRQPEDPRRPRRRGLRLERREGLDHQRGRGGLVRRHGHDGPFRGHSRDHRVSRVLGRPGAARRARRKTRWVCASRRRPRSSSKTCGFPRAAGSAPRARASRSR